MVKYPRLLIRSWVIWNLIVWSVLVKNMLINNTDSIGFRAVHIGLAIISVAFAIAAWPLAKHIHVPERDKNS